MNDPKPIAEWTLDVTTWQGTSLGAVHYYAAVRAPGGDRHDVEYTPDDDEARRMMEHDQHRDKGASEASRLRWAKMTTGRFWTREKAIATAVQFYLKTASGPSILALKDYCSGDAAPVVASVGVPAKVVRRMNALGESVRKAWDKHQVRAGFYFDLKPGARRRVDRAGAEYRRILATGNLIDRPNQP